VQAEFAEQFVDALVGFGFHRGEDVTVKRERQIRL
jgi:Fe2+ transport system protein FeoA